MKNEGGLQLKGLIKRTRPGKPLITIITVVYNGERYLEQAIRSVLGQSYDNLEYIIIDGKSTDSSLDIIKRYGKRIDYWVSETDNGISDAMNKGIRSSNGDIIAHLHADDYYVDNSVVSRVQRAFADNKEAWWLTGGMTIIRQSNSGELEIRVRDYSFEKLIHDNIILHPSTFIKRKAFEQVGLFNDSLKYAMDYDLWLRIGRLGNPITIDQTLTCFRAHAHSRSVVSCDSALFEEWAIRRKFLKNRPLKILCQYLRFNIKKYKNRRFYRSMLPELSEPNSQKRAHSSDVHTDPDNPLSK